MSDTMQRIKQKKWRIQLYDEQKQMEQIAVNIIFLVCVCALLINFNNSKSKSWNSFKNYHVFVVCGVLSFDHT